VAFARALANAPEAMLLDEPTSALDGPTRDHVEALLREIIIERHLACVLVTHDSGQARRLADRVVVLERGRVARTGRPRVSAGLFQLVTLELVLAAGALTAIVSIRLLRARVFTSADPLALPPVHSA